MAEVSSRSPHGGSSSPAGPFGLALAVKVVTAVWCLLPIVDCMAAYRAVAAWQEPTAGGLVWSQAETTLYDSTGYLYLPMQIVAFLVGSQWLYRSRLLADDLLPSYRHVHRPSRVWLAWALPVVNLWFPFQVVRDVHRATIGPAARTASVRLWWLLWLLWLTADVASYAVAGAATGTGADAAPASVLFWLATGSALLCVACAALWLRLIEDITSAQRARLATLETVA